MLMMSIQLLDLMTIRKVVLGLIKHQDLLEWFF